MGPGGTSGGGTEGHQQVYSLWYVPSTFLVLLAEVVLMVSGYLQGGASVQETMVAVSSSALPHQGGGAVGVTTNTHRLMPPTASRRCAVLRAVVRVWTILPANLPANSAMATWTALMAQMRSVSPFKSQRVEVYTNWSSSLRCRRED